MMLKNERRIENNKSREKRERGKKKKIEEEVGGGKRTYAIGGGEAPIRFRPIYLPPGEEGGFLSGNSYRVPSQRSHECPNGRQL